MNNHIEKGKEGEQLAETFLLDAGYEILERNYRFGRGEIDLIAMDGEYCVFVEVKTRTSESFGAPVYAVPVSKQKQIARIAQGYIYEHGLTCPCRFDVVTIEYASNTPVIEHLINAFICR